VIRGDHYGARISREEIERVTTWIDINAPYYGSYTSAYGDNAFGRSPLTNDQLKQLSELSGRELGGAASEQGGSQVSFTRPELSPCLDGFTEKNDPRYIKALAIIRTGRWQLAQQPREDMLGAEAKPVHPHDVKRHQRYLEWFAAEQAHRQALVREQRGEAVRQE